jgi:hypothetical protein
MRKATTIFLVCIVVFSVVNGQSQLSSKYRGIVAFYGASIILIESNLGAIKIKQVAPMEVIGASYMISWLKNNHFQKVSFVLTKRTFRNGISDLTGAFSNSNDSYILSTDYVYGVNLIGVFHLGVLGGAGLKLKTTVTPTDQSGYRYEIVQALKKSFTLAELYTGLQMSLEYKLISIVGIFTKNVSNIYGKGTLNGQLFSISSKPYFYTFGVGVKF